MRRFSIFVLVLGIAMLGSGVAMAQSNVSTGELLGAVVDTQGGVLPGVTVEATNSDTGFTRRAVTDPRGEYRLPSVPVGTYSIRAELAGFRPAVREGVVVNLGTSVKVDFQLELGNLQEEVVVTAAAPLVETTRADVANAVGSRQIADLPLNGRDFLDFIALTPQTITDDSGRAHVGGQRGIQNNFNIDGANAQSDFFGEERGGTRPAFTFSQAAIKEFQVIPSSYNVQFGNASGGIINAITKSGTNTYQGEAWYYFRNDSMVSKDALGRPATEFKQQQFGVDLGGPIVKDKLHFFVSYDGQRKDYPIYRSFYNFPAGKEAEFKAKTGLDLSNEIGRIVSTNDDDVVLAKLDWQISSSVLGTLRENYSNYKGQNATADYTTTGWSNNGIEQNKFNSVVGNINAVLSPSAFNEFIGQWSKEERPRTANYTAIPEVRIGSSYDATFGQNNFLPNNLIEDRTQLIDNFTAFAGEHTFKAGFNVDLVKYDDYFFRYQGGQYYFRSWNDFFNDNVYQYIQSFSNFDGRVKFDTNYYAGYVQDEWRPAKNLTLNFGIRYDLQENPSPKETNPLFPNTGTIPTDRNNWAPRASFAWDPYGDGKTVVRGGVGYFYDITPTLLLANAMLTNGLRVATVTLYCGPTVECPTFPNTIPSLGDLPTARPDLFVFKPNFQNPKTLRWSLGTEHQLANDYKVGGEFVWSKTTHLERIFDLNLVPVGYTAFGTTLYNYRLKNDPNFGAIRQFTDDGEARYWAVVLKGSKRWSDKWMFDASYTYSKSRDNNSNERSVSSSGYAYPEDQMNPNGDWGPSDFDVTHRFVLSAVVLLPGDVQFSTIVKVHSGFPYTAGDYRDLNNDRYYSDRAYYAGKHYGRNTFRQPWYRNVDLRLSKIFRFAHSMEVEVLGEAFNVFNFDNLRTTRTQMINSSGNLNANFGSTAANASPIVGDPRQYQVGVKFRW